MHASSTAGPRPVLALDGLAAFDSRMPARLMAMDISWAELMVVVLVALVVIGPKNLPAALGALGRSVGAMRRLSHEFQRQLAELMRESEVGELRRQFEAAIRPEEFAPGTGTPTPGTNQNNKAPNPAGPAVPHGKRKTRPGD